MTDTQNRVLSFDEVLALEEGRRVWVEHAKGYGKSHIYRRSAHPRTQPRDGRG